MSYLDFMREMDSVNRKGINNTANTLKDLRAEIKELKQTTTEVLGDNRDRIDTLYDRIYDLLPELEVIETMADNPEEEAELLNKYLNLNNDYLD